jgi:hypothetical protein
LIVAHNHRSLQKRARKALIRAKNLPSATLLPTLTLITMAGRTGLPLDRAWYRHAAHYLKKHPIQPESVDALDNLNHCQIEGPCKRAPHRMLPIFLAALSKRPHDGNLLATYSQFAHYQLHDRRFARRMARLAVKYAHFPDLQRRALKPILEPDRKSAGQGSAGKTPVDTRLPYKSGRSSP